MQDKEKITIERIVKLLKLQGKSKKDLCAYLNVAPSNFGNWIAGRNTSYMRYIHGIAKFLNTTPEYLSGETDVIYENSDNSKVRTNFKNILVENDENAIFWDKFLKLCNDRHIAPSAVCDAVGLSNSSPSKWKNGATPNAAALHKIAEYFGMPADYFREARMFRKHLVAVKRPKGGKPANISLTDEEIELVRAYRERKDMQAAVKTLLGMDKKLHTVFVAAQSSSDIYETPGYKQVDESILEKIKNAPESDDDLM